MITAVSEKKLKTLIRESVKEALDTEIMKLRAFAAPHVSESEQKDIEKRYGRPSTKRARNSDLIV